MDAYDQIIKIPKVASLMQNADHIDVKMVIGNISLRQFIASALSYQPGWMTFLYRIQGWLVRLLGMRQDGTPTAPRLSAEDVSLTPGEKAFFFTVVAAEEERYWIAGDDEDKHLAVYVVIAAESLEGEKRRFSIMTIVHYKNWAGPVYFNVIRPFHHIVVRAAINAAVKRPVEQFAISSSGETQ